MNRYHESMEHCAPPPELEERLREAVLSAAPGPRTRTAVYRPRGFVRKALLAAVLAVALTLSVGAAVLVHWDDIFSDRFGPEGAETPMAEKAFQPVNVSSVCDDVTVTIREALVSEQTVYLILDYQLPDTVDRELVQQADSSDDDFIYPPDVGYYLTGDVSWEDLKAADQEKWSGLNWSNSLSYGDYMRGGNALWAYHLSKYSSGSSGEIASQGYDPNHNTLTYLCSITAKSGDLDFTAQPLTLLVTPPVLRVNGVETALANHPALVTFQPSAVSQTLTGTVRQDHFYGEAAVSPLAISVKVTEVSGVTPYRDAGELRAGTSLVYRDGSVQPVTELTISGLTGSGNLKDQDHYRSLSFTSQFQELLDVSQVTAVRVGDVTIPLT